MVTSRPPHTNQARADSSPAPGTPALAGVPESPAAPATGHSLYASAHSSFRSPSPALARPALHAAPEARPAPPRPTPSQPAPAHTSPARATRAIRGPGPGASPGRKPRAADIFHSNSPGGRGRGGRGPAGGTDGRTASFPPSAAAPASRSLDLCPTGATPSRSPTAAARSGSQLPPASQRTPVAPPAPAPAGQQPLDTPARIDWGAWDAETSEHGTPDDLRGGGAPLRLGGSAEHSAAWHPPLPPLNVASRVVRPTASAGRCDAGCQ